MTAGNKHRVLLTGATGYVGSNLALRLISEGWELHAIVRRESDVSRLGPVRDSIRFHCHDGTTEGMQRIVEAAEPELVFHLASLFLSEHRPADVERLVTSNILFSSQLLEAMSLAGVTLLVNAGTSWQHYEGRAYSPVNLYSATKQAFEAIIQYYEETAGIKAVTLKLFDTYGPGDWRPKLFSLLRTVAESGKPLAMSPGEQMIDLVYIDDVTDAFLAAADLLFSGRVQGHERYAVSSGSPIRLRDLVDAFSRELGRDIPIQWGGRPYRPREVMKTWQGPAIPGWAPRIPLSEGIGRLFGHSAVCTQERG